MQGGEIIEDSGPLSGYEFEQTPGDSGGQRSLARCGPRDHKESDTTEGTAAPLSGTVLTHPPASSVPFSQTFFMSRDQAPEFESRP